MTNSEQSSNKVGHIANYNLGTFKTQSYMLENFFLSIKMEGLLGETIISSHSNGFLYKDTETVSDH